MTVLVTGGTSGLGRALVRRFSDRDRVVFTSRCPERVAREVEALRGRDVHGVVCSVDDVACMSRLFDEHRPDVVVNNAACSGGFGRFVDTDLEGLRDVVSTNLVGTLVSTRLALRGGEAHVFNVVGAGADGSATPNYAAYGATKAAVLQLARSLEAEGHGFVHTVSPGMMMTPLLTAGAPSDLVDGAFRIVCEDPDVVADRVVGAIDRVVRRGLRGQRIRVFDPFAALWRALRRPS